MKTEKEQQEFYDRLKKELDDTTPFPTKYLYKFIIPNVTEKMEQLLSIFEGREATINKRISSNEKYISISVSIWLETSDEVIMYYKEAGKIEGILSL